MKKLTSLLLIAVLTLPVLATQLVWERNPEPEVQYRVYMGATSRHDNGGGYSNMIDTGSATNMVIIKAPGSVIYYAIVAYDTNGLESEFSDELRVVFPGKPRNVRLSK
jgi:hypothetical protein